LQSGQPGRTPQEATEERHHGQGGRGHPLSERQKLRNRLISAIRGIVERGFGTLKRSYGQYRAKYLGVIKVEAAFLLAALAFNLKKAVSCPIKKPVFLSSA